jgi:hypothetical protein
MELEIKTTDLGLKTRKFTSNDRRKIVLKIAKLKNKKDFISIYLLIKDELGKNISINKNGIFFNVNILSDKCLVDLSLFLNDALENSTETETKVKYNAYSIDDIDNISNMGPKLSNQEKSIIKKIIKF